MLVFCLSVYCVCVPGALEAEEGVRSTGTGAMDGCELHVGTGKAFGRVITSTEPSPQPLP